MDIVLDVIGWILLLAGSAFSIIGGLGVVRFPDFYTRLHGGGITDTMGAGLILTGLMVMTFSLEVASVLAVVKLMIILVFLLITSPTACHAVAQSALSCGLKPMTGNPHKSEERDPA